MKYSFKLDNINGFSHKIPMSLIQTNVIEETGVILPLKNSLRFYNGLKSKQIVQTQRDISSIAMAGPYIAIGVKGYLGELITTYFLNIYEVENVKKLCYQKTKISQLQISSNGKYILSLGQPDSKTYLFSNQGKTLSSLTQNKTLQQVEDFHKQATKIFFRNLIKGKQKIVDMAFSSTDPNMFALLYIDRFYFARIVQQIQEVQQVMIKANRVRQFHAILFNQDDTYCYTVSKNGDIAEIDVAKGKQVRVGPKKRVIISGIKIIKRIDAQNLLIIAEKGFIAVVEITELKIIKEVTLNEEIVSVTDFIDGVAFVSTQKAIIYKIFSDTLEAKVFYVCVKDKINEVAFSDSCPDTVLTCSSNQIIIWGLKDMKPQLKIAIPKIQCSSICMDKYGKFIISAWSDGCIRIFTAYNGKLMKKLENCHPGPISKIIIDYNQTKMISGGQKGQVKVWDLSEKKLGLAMGSMSHHIKRVNQLKINPQKFQEMICCSQDGCYSVWNLETYDLIYSYKVCNFLKDAFFVDMLTVQFVGSGSYMYKVIKANGKITEKIQINNSHTNCISSFDNTLDHKMVIYGGQTQYVYILNHTMPNQPVFQVKVFSQVTAIKILPNKESIIVGTNDGIISKLQMKEEFVQSKIQLKKDQFSDYSNIL